MLEIDYEILKICGNCSFHIPVEFREDEEISHEIIEKLKSGKEMKPKFLKDLLLEIQIDNTQHYLKTKDVIEKKISY